MLKGYGLAEREMPDFGGWKRVMKMRWQAPSVDEHIDCLSFFLCSRIHSAHDGLGEPFEELENRSLENGFDTGICILGHNRGGCCHAPSELKEPGKVQ